MDPVPLPSEEVIQMTQSSHGDILLSKLYSLFRAQSLCDVALVTKDEQKCYTHATVLASHSTYFHDELVRTYKEAVENTIHVPSDIDANILRTVVKFFYTGVLEITGTSVWHLLSAGTQLGIQSICDLCHEYFRRKANGNFKAKVSPKSSKQPRKTAKLNKATASVFKVSDQSKEKQTNQAPTGQMVTNLNVSAIIKSEDDFDNSVPDDVEDDAVEEVVTVRKSSRLRIKTEEKEANKKRKRTGDPVGPRAKRSRNSAKHKAAKTAKTRKSTGLGKKSDRDKSIPRRPQRLEDSQNSSKNTPFRSFFSYQLLRKGLVVTDERNVKNVACAVTSCHSRRFSSYSSYRKHFQNYHLKKFGCRKCEKQFCTYSRLRKHIRNVHQGPFGICDYQQENCPRCKRPFLHKRNLLAHMLVCNSNSVLRRSKHLERRRNIAESPVSNTIKRVPCHLCKESFLTKLNLTLHMKAVHKGNTPRIPTSLQSSAVKYDKGSRWICMEENCSFKCNTQQQLSSHVKSAHPTTGYHCAHENCKYQTPVLAMMERHNQSKHSKDKKCEHCGQEFRKNYFLRIHLYTKHGIQDSSIKIHKCPKEGCYYETYQRNIMEKHVWRHDADKTFTCKECDKKLKTEKNLEKHMKKVHLKIRPYVCDQCGASYGELSELKVHIQRHSKEKQFKCEHCDYESHDKGNFQSHLWAKHKVKLGNKVKLYKCNVCDYTCDRKTRFDQHMNSHMGIRPHKCPTCGQEFLSKSTMTAHIKWKHQEKNLKCDYCSYRCGSLNFLREHVRVQHTHRNIKPYKCVYCEYRCAVSGNCRKHIMNRHKGLPVKWEKVCDKWGPNNDRPILAVEKTLTNHLTHNMDVFNQSVERMIAGTGKVDMTVPTEQEAGIDHTVVGSEVFVQHVPVTSEIEVPASSFPAGYQPPQPQDVSEVLIQVQEAPQQQQVPQQQQAAPDTSGEQGENQLMYYSADSLVIPGQHDYTQNVFYQIQ